MPELIDREASLKLCSDTHNPYHRIVREFLLTAPTVDAEPVRHGRWIYNGYDEYPTCSCCKQSDTYAGDYCGNCGAQMDADHIADDSKKI